MQLPKALRMKTIPNQVQVEQTQVRARGFAHAFRLQASRLRLRAAFTLNELLVVMAIIILVLAIAIPAFSLITTGKSIEASENQMSAFLSAVRADAVGMQDPRGAVIFVDPVNNRLTMVEVWFPPQQRPIIDIYPGKEEMKLPAGVGMRAIPNSSTNNPTQVDQWPHYCVIMFDANGRLLMDSIRFTNAGSNALAARLTFVASTTDDKMPPPGRSFPFDDQSYIGFVLFDKARHDEQPKTPPAVLQKWLSENGVPYLVNRYNGTLMRGQ